MTALALVTKAIDIIEIADIRASAADGPVAHVRDEMSDSEWRQLYLALVEARETLMQEAESREASAYEVLEHEPDN